MGVVGVLPLEKSGKTGLLTLVAFACMSPSSLPLVSALCDFSRGDSVLP